MPARIALSLGPVSGFVGEALEFSHRHFAAAERERLRDRYLALRPLVDATPGLRGGRAHGELARRNDDHARAIGAVLEYGARPRRSARRFLCVRRRLRPGPLLGLRHRRGLFLLGNLRDPPRLSLNLQRQLLRAVRRLLCRIPRICFRPCPGLRIVRRFSRGDMPFFLLARQRFGRDAQGFGRGRAVLLQLAVVQEHAERDGRDEDRRRNRPRAS